MQHWPPTTGSCSPRSRTTGGYVFSKAGDAFAAAFWTPDEAIQAAVEGQRHLGAETWPKPVVLRVRMGVHTGTADERDGDYFGPAVNRAGRLMSAAHGGQIVCSALTAATASPDLARKFTIQRLGTYRLKDLLAPEVVLQVNGPGSTREFRPLRSLDRLRHNLPVQHTRLIGRQEEIASVVEHLGRSHLVTLTGIGGSGKTRLALAVAAELAPAFADGVFFVPLADKPGGGVVEAVMQAMSVRLASAAPRDVAALVAPQDVLLVVDNCEHVVNEVANVVEHILARGPSCRLLVTSREALTVGSEQVVRVPPLRVDTTGNDGGISPAAELFLDRARAAGMQAGVTPEAEAVLGEVCRRLDGVPLAIELAAAQLSILSPVDLLDRLDRRFDLLVDDRRRPQRQQALQAMMDWSWELLTIEEQRLLAVVSVFTGQWSLEGAEALGAKHVSGAVTGVLQRLVAKSLVEPVFTPGRRRFRLLETVRLYAAARLEEMGLADGVHADHVGFHVGRARQIGPERALLDLDSMDAVLLDLHDLDAAIAWCVARSAWSDAAELAVLAGGSWTAGIQTASGVRWVRVVAARLEDRCLRARLLAVGSFVAGAAGQHDTMRRWAREALELARAGDHFATALAALLEAAPNILRKPDTAARSLLDARTAAEQGSSELAGLVQQWINMAAFCEPDLDLPVKPTDDAAAFGGSRSFGWRLARCVAALSVAEEGDYEAALALLPAVDSAIRAGTPEEKWYRMTVEALAGDPALVLEEAGALVVEVNRFSDVTGHAELLVIFGIALTRSGRWAEALEHIEVARRAPMTLPVWYALARRFGLEARGQLQEPAAGAIVERARSYSVDELLRRQLV